LKSSSRSRFPNRLKAMRIAVRDADIRNLFSYNSQTGAIFWVARGRGRIKKKPAGTVISTGYIGVLVNGKRYLAHRIAWFLHFGEWPIDQINHINGIRTDNSILNLRLATNAQNGKNYGNNKSNKSGFKGVSWCKYTGKWRSTIKVDGKTLDKGRYSDINDAIFARGKAEIEHFGEWRRKCP
jgi:HNH endonuclease